MPANAFIDRGVKVKISPDHESKGEGIVTAVVGMRQFCTVRWDDKRVTTERLDQLVRA